MFGKRKPKRFYWFVYLVPEGDRVELKCPNGGITSTGYDEIDAFDAAYCSAVERFARRPWETLVLTQCRTEVKRRQAELMELDKKRADNAFRLQMLEAMAGGSYPSARIATRRPVL